MIYARLTVDALCALLLVAAPFWLAPVLGWWLKYM